MQYIKKIIDLAKEKQGKDFDSVFIICGTEGTGKSHLGLNCVDHLGGNIKNIALDKEDFIEVLSDIKDEDIVMFDEAGDGLFSRDFASKSNKDLVKTFMIIRAKRLITFLVLPTFFMIDTYFRKHRVRGLFYVYQRGKVAFYDKQGIEKIMRFGEKNHKITGRPAFRDHYPEYKGRLLEEYKKKKAKKIKETLEALKPENQEKEKKQKEKELLAEEIMRMEAQGLTQQEIADIKQVSRKTINQTKRKFVTGKL